MRTLLRNSSNGSFYIAPNRWTSNLSKAHNFKLISAAIRFAQEHRLVGAELILALDDPAQITAIPLEKFHRGLSRLKSGARPEKSRAKRPSNTAANWSRHVKPIGSPSCGI